MSEIHRERYMDRLVQMIKGRFWSQLKTSGVLNRRPKAGRKAITPIKITVTERTRYSLSLDGIYIR